MEDAIALEQSPKKLYPYSYSIELTGSTVEKIRAKIAPLRFKLAAEKIVEELKIKSEDRVLELGSGLGLLGREIKKIVGTELNYVGIDLFLSSLRKTKRTILPIQADVVSLPFANNSFDKLVSTDVLEHLPNAEVAVEEIFRVLKPGGRAFMVIADPSEGRFIEVTNHIRRSEKKTDVAWWEKLFQDKGLEVLSEASAEYRQKDWRRVFNLPFLAKFKDKSGFACAFNPINRPGTYVLKKPEK